MSGRVYAAMWLLAMLGHVNSLKLTKEISINELSKIQEPASSVQSLTDALKAMNDIDIREQLVGWFFNPNGQVENYLQDFLSRSEQPQVSEVIDVFNAGLGRKLLIIEDNYIHVDPTAFEKLFSEGARSFSRALYPKNIFQQLVVFSMLQQRINEVGSRVRPLIAESKIPVQDLSAILAGESIAISKRDTSGLVRTDLLTTICEAFSSAAYTSVNATLTTSLTFLESISVSSGDDVLVNIIAAVISVVKEYLEELFSTINEYAYDLSTSVCSLSANSTTTSRRRRATEFDFVKRNTELSVLSERALATRSILDTIYTTLWVPISSVLNESFTDLVNTLLTLVQSIADDFINSTLDEYLQSLIDAIFPA